MGKTLLGGDTRQEDIGLLSPEQSSFLSQSLSGSNAYGDLTQQYDPQQFSELFQKSFVDPSMQALQRQIIPGIKESFLGLDESGSGSLNRALAQSATDVSTGLGQQYMNFFNQQQQNKLGALGQLGGLAGQRTFEPHIEQTQGILGPILQAIGAVAGGSLSGGGSAGIGMITDLLKSMLGGGGTSSGQDPSSFQSSSQKMGYNPANFGSMYSAY